MVSLLSHGEASTSHSPQPVVPKVLFHQSSLKCLLKMQISEWPPVILRLGSAPLGKTASDFQVPGGEDAALFIALNKHLLNS